MSFLRQEEKPLFLMTVIAHAEPGNAEAPANLATDMDRFYGATEPLELRMGQISEALFHDPPSAHALLAWDNERLVDLASYSFLLPAVGLTR
jgi:hypothetical protein